MTRPAAPSGATPPVHAFTADGASIDLRPIAQEICRRYQSEFPDEADRYGPAGIEWCLHDNLYLLAWAVQDARDSTVVLTEQVVWLAGVLSARDFPIARLIRDLQIASDVIRSDLPARDLATSSADLLAAAASRVAELQ